MILCEDTLYIPEDGADAVDATVAAYAVSDSAYPAMISSQYVDYFASIVKAHPLRDYLLFRQDNYNYILVFDGSLSLSGNLFTGSGEVVRLYTGSTSGKLSYSSLGYQSISVSVDNAPVFSNLGNFGTLGGVNRATLGLLALFGIIILFRFVSGFFR